MPMQNKVGRNVDKIRKVAAGSVAKGSINKTIVRRLIKKSLKGLM